MRGLSGRQSEVKALSYFGAPLKFPCIMMMQPVREQDDGDVFISLILNIIINGMLYAYLCETDDNGIHYFRQIKGGWFRIGEVTIATIGYLTRNNADA